MFKDLVGSTGRGKSRSKTSLFVSGVVHGELILLLIVIPLMHYETLPAAVYVGVPLKPPPPSKPPQPPSTATPADVLMRKAVEVTVAGLVEPETVPIGIPDPTNEIPDISTLSSNGYGSPIGIPNGYVGPMVNCRSSNVLNQIRAAAPPPPPARNKPVQIASTLQTAKLIRRIAPSYPPLARQARVEGIVLLQALVDETGTVAEVRSISGNPLIIKEAVKALKQWKYSPTLLNREPVPVIATVTVNFVLK